VPLPVPVLTVTVRVLPLPLTLVTDAPDRPPPSVTSKSLPSSSMPMTGSLKVTVYWTLSAFVGEVPTASTDSTVGSITSTSISEEAAEVAFQFSRCATTR
jgi:hypothetical protein